MKRQKYLGKKRLANVPEHIYEDTKKLADVFHVTMPKAFAIREEIYGEIIKKKKTKKGETIQIRIK